jgi:hypothetical protein
MRAEYRWFRGAPEAWEAVEGATEFEYVPGADDVGQCLLCEAVAVAKSGLRSVPCCASLEDPVRPASERFRILSEAFCTGTVLRTNAGDRPVRWERDDGTALGEGIEYLVTASDVGRSLVASFRQFRTEPSPKCTLKAPLDFHLRSIMQRRKFAFTGHPRAGKVNWEVAMDARGLRMSRQGMFDRACEWAKVRVEAVRGSRDEMRIFFDSSARFLMIPELRPGSPLQKSLGKDLRDLVVAVIMAFCEELHE